MKWGKFDIKLKCKLKKRKNCCGSEKKTSGKLLYRYCGPGFVVGIAIGYGLDGPGIEF